MSKLMEFWWSNVQKNYKLISAFITEIAITSIILIAYGLRAEQPIIDIMFTVWISTNTAMFIILRLIGKGEVADVQERYLKEVDKNRALTQQIEYDQVIAGYAIQLAALKGQIPESIIQNEKWINANDLLKKVNSEVKTE